MVAKGCEGDWEYKTPKVAEQSLNATIPCCPQAPVPVKLTVKKMVGSDWMVACMVPRGNMMHCMLRWRNGDIYGS
jgi:hypothetical protein